MEIIIFLKAIYSRIGLIVSVALASALIAFILTKDYKKAYKSTAQISTGYTISNEIPRFSLEGDRFNVYEINIKFDNLVETMRSSTVVGMLSYRLLLHDIETLEPFRQVDVENLDQEQRDIFVLPDPKHTANILRNKIDSLTLLSSFNKEERSVLELLTLYEYDYESILEMITVGRLGFTDYVAVECVSENNLLSAYVVNTLCTEFLRFNYTTKTVRTDESVEVLANLVRQKRMELDEKSEMLRQFKSSQGVLNFSMESESKITQLQTYENSLAEEQKIYRGLILSLEDINKRIANTGGGQNPGSVALLSNNTDIVNLRRKINSLNQQYIQAGSSDLDLQDQIKDLRIELINKINLTQPGAMGQNFSPQDLGERKAELEVQAKISQQNIQAIENSIRNLRSNVGAYASKEATISSLERELELATEEYKEAQEKYNSALNMTSSQGNSIRQSLQGQPAVEPEPSKRLIITGLTGITTTVLSTLLIILFTYLDTTIKSPKTFSQLVPLRLVGHTSWQRKLDMPQIFHIFNTDQLATQQAAYRERIKKVRFEIEQSGQQIWLVTSTQRKQGKSTVALALACSLSLNHRKVLLVDLNLPAPSLTNWLFARPLLQQALGAPVADLSPNQTATAEADHPKDFPAIAILGAASSQASPSELLDSQKLMSFLQQAKAQYDYIVIESAHLNDYSHARELMRFVEGVLAVFSARMTLHHSDFDSINYLAGLKEKPVLSILTMVGHENQD